MKHVSPATRRAILWVLAVVPLALVLGSVVYNATALPGCVSCHDEVNFVAGTEASAHTEVTCASCHVGTTVADRLAFGMRESFHMALPLIGGEGRDWSAVPDARCLACHEKVEQQVVSANGLRISHTDCAVESECSDCHSTTAHGDATSWVRVYDMETCLECHVSKASTECNLCHEGRLPANRVKSGVFAITHGPEWEKTHGMGAATTCTACHTAANCEKCHGAGLPHAVGFVKKHAEVATSTTARCQTCHEPAFCSDCHGLEMPHPTTFTRNHAEPAETNANLCKRCHAEPDCSGCHETHVHPGGAIGTLGSGGGQ